MAKGFLCEALSQQKYSWSFVTPCLKATTIRKIPNIVVRNWNSIQNFFSGTPIFSYGIMTKTSVLCPKSNPSWMALQFQIICIIKTRIRRVSKIIIYSLKVSRPPHQRSEQLFLLTAVSLKLLRIVKNPLTTVC